MFEIEENISDALMSYQKSIIRQPFENCVTITSEYDFYGYFNRIYSDDYAPLEMKKTTIVSEGTELRSWDEYARICIWYGRRDDAQLNTGKKNTIKR